MVSVVRPHKTDFFKGAVPWESIDAISLQDVKTERRGGRGDRAGGVRCRPTDILLQQCSTQSTLTGTVYL
jgi:hypothetical protein